MFISKMSLPRRTFLRGVGATVALPLLDAMVPALTAVGQTAAAPRLRFGAIYVPNGIIMNQWTPATVGSGFDLPPTLQPLQPFQDKLTVVSNTYRGGEADHAVACAAWLSGAVPKKTEGQDFRLEHDDRSDRRQAGGRGHRVPLDRGGHRGLHRLRRRLQPRLQLRLHEHPRVGDADHAAPDRDQSARGVQAPVRAAGDRRPARHLAEARIAAFSTRSPRTPTTCSA